MLTNVFNGHDEAATSTRASQAARNSSHVSTCVPKNMEYLKGAISYYKHYVDPGHNQLRS